MARPLKPLIRGGGYYPSKRWTPLVYPGGYTTMNGGGEPPAPINWQTISGTSPLTLANSLAHELRSLIQYGKCAQASTPTPNAPVDIVCNNGALRMVDDELPTGYKRVLGFACDNNAMWEIDGFHLKGSDTVRISFSINGACNVFGCYQGADATDNYDLYASTSSGSKYFRYGSGTYLSYWSSSNLGQRFDVVYTPNGSQGMPQDSTWTPKTFTSANDLLIGSTTLTGSSSKLKGELYGNITVDGRLKLIPCERVSDGVLGYYDTYGEAFYEPYEGFDGAVSLGYDGSHYTLGVVGTPEVLTLAPVGSASQAETPTPEAPVPVVGTMCGDTVLYALGDVKDTFDPVTQTITRRVGSHAFDGTERFSTSTAYGSCIILTKTNQGWGADQEATPMCNYYQGIPKVTGGTQEADTCFFNGTGHWYFRTSLSLDDFTAWIVARAAAGNPVVNYFALQTPVTEAYTGTPVGEVVNDVPTLLSVNDYKDEGEIISGLLTHKVGIKVLDGTESGWALSDSGSTHRFRGIKPSDCHTPASRAPSVCTHFKYVSTGSAVGGMFIGDSQYWYFIPTDQTIDTVDKWTAWVAGQYAARTPVIVIYPLAEETTEQTTPHSLHSYEGTTVVEADTNVDPVGLSAEYASSEE